MSLVQTVRFVAYGLTYDAATALIKALATVGIQASFTSSSGVSMFLTEAEKEMADTICLTYQATLTAESEGFMVQGKVPVSRTYGFRQKGKAYASEPDRPFVFRLCDIANSGMMDADDAVRFFVDGAQTDTAYGILDEVAWKAVRLLQRDFWLSKWFAEIFTKRFDVLFDMQAIARWEKANPEMARAAWTVSTADDTNLLISFTFEGVTLALTGVPSQLQAAQMPRVSDGVVDEYDLTLTVTKDGIETERHETSDAMSNTERTTYTIEPADYEHGKQVVQAFTDSGILANLTTGGVDVHVGTSQVEQFHSLCQLFNLKPFQGVTPRMSVSYKEALAAASDDGVN